MEKKVDKIKKQDISHKLICSICLLIFRNPVIDTCGHTFCKSCLIKWLQKNRKCPQSRKRVENFFPNLLIKDLVSNLILICKECKEEFKIKNKNYHKLICKFKKNDFTKEMVIKEYFKLFDKYKLLTEKIEIINDKKNEENYKRNLVESINLPDSIQISDLLEQGGPLDFISEEENVSVRSFSSDGSLRRNSSSLRRR